MKQQGSTVMAQSGTIFARFRPLLLSCLVALFSGATQAAGAAGPAACPDKGVWLQVLGAGGPDMVEGQAASGYLVWQDGRARVLVDIGDGVVQRMRQSGAKFEDLDAIVLSHLHADHSAGLPSLIRASRTSRRKRTLPLFGPAGSKTWPATSRFVRKLFKAPDGVFRELDRFISGKGKNYRLKASNVPIAKKRIWRGFKSKGLTLSAVPVHHGRVPALAWRIDIGGRSITFSGDMSGRANTLPRLAMRSNLLVAHNTVPEGVKGTARRLHMPPSVIGAIAERAAVGRLILTHRTRQTYGREDETRKIIRQSYGGFVDFAKDLQCFEAKPPVAGEEAP